MKRVNFSFELESYSDTFAGSTVLSNLTQTKYWLHFQWNGCDDAALLILFTRCCYDRNDAAAVAAVIITEAVYVWNVLNWFALSPQVVDKTSEQASERASKRMRARVTAYTYYYRGIYSRFFVWIRVHMGNTGNECSSQWTRESKRATTSPCANVWVYESTFDRWFSFASM